MFFMFGMFTPHIIKAVTLPVFLWNHDGFFTIVMVALQEISMTSVSEDTILLGPFWTVYHGIALQNRKWYGLFLTLNM